MLRIAAIVLAISATSPSAAADIFLQCSGYSRIPGQPPVDNDAEFSIRVNIEKSQIEYDDRTYRIYDAGETKLGAYTKWKSPDGKVTNLVQMTLDRVSGKFSTIWQNSRMKKGSEYVYVFKYDPEETELESAPLQYVQADCTAKERLL